MNPIVQFILMTQTAQLPKRATPYSAGYDLFCDIKEAIAIHPGETIKIPTGLKINIDCQPFAMFALPRSGKGSDGLVLGNLVGLIDPDYQGHVLITAWNRTKDTFFGINPGDSICQCVFLPFVTPDFNAVSAFDVPTIRGEGGFGHTDKRGLNDNNLTEKLAS